MTTTLTCPLCQKEFTREVQAMMCFGGPNKEPTENDRRLITQFAQLMVGTCDDCKSKVQKTDWRIHA